MMSNVTKYGCCEAYCGMVEREGGNYVEISYYIRLENEKIKLQAQLKKAQREIEILRQYGNKDCTAMADEALNKKVNNGD